MENEVKEEVKVEEPKKKGNGFFTVFACVMTGIIVFLACNLGDKASKVVDPETNSGDTTTSNVESNVASNAVSNTDSNVVSNVTSNVVSNTTTSNTAATKLTDAEALAVGKDLYKKAEYYYPFPLASGIHDLCVGENADMGDYDCTSFYNELKKVYTADNEVFKQFTLKDGKYYFSYGGTGYIGVNTTTLALKSNDVNTISFTATTVTTALIDENRSETSTSSADFVIVKENGTWKVSTYTFKPGNTLK